MPLVLHNNNSSIFSSKQTSLKLQAKDEYGFYNALQFSPNETYPPIKFQYETSDTFQVMPRHRHGCGHG